MSDNLDRQISGPTLELAALVKKMLESEGKIPEIQTEYGVFHISKIELMMSDAGEGYVVGYLTPDEGEGDTLNFWTPKVENP